MIVRCVIFLLLSVMTSSAMAVSLDCLQASNYAEREICGDGFLTGANERLERTYWEAMELSEDQQALQHSQRQWIDLRDTCTDQKCLDDMLSQRHQVLLQYIREAKERALTSAWEEQEAQRQARYAREQAERDAERARLDAERQERAQASVAAATMASQQSAAPQPQPQPQPPAAPPAGKSLWDRFTDGPAWKYTLLLLLGVLATAVSLHRSGELTIYIDYTDAMVTNLLPVAGLVAWGLLSWLDIHAFIPTFIAIAAVLLVLVFALITSWRANDAGWKVVVSFLGKITLMGLFYVLIALLLASMLSTKYKDETRAQAAARNRRNHRAARIQIAGLTAGYTFLTRWLCRNSEFSSISECLAFYPEGEEVN